ncbi:30S ribosomal protein S8 [Candidatus Gottesmanbacteria bacterium RBG_13_37_7]|uniref:Small ribosomal subunit protein uS8 n=1 Tax=Candidatus Gottesmanbacteria bacterium RBG_13_37_7 TaxID=1798369 RepID=A0A1F5YJ46_9BACT|nr:MAG: 30S ribosomal protein S8 [Candidatus Gottesmanbacteria bacterium RBG_13_37_7]
MLTDTTSDLLTRIKNAYMAGKKTITVPHSNFKEKIAQLLFKEGYVGEVKKVKKDKIKKDLEIALIYKNNKPRITDIIIVSKISRRTYVSNREIPSVLGGLGIVVLSTSHGVMSGRDARKKKIGGEVICKIW